MNDRRSNNIEIVENMKQRVQTCILCGNSVFKRISKQLRDSHQHTVVTCLTCGHVQISPIPSPEEDKDFYNKNRQARNIGKTIDINRLKKISPHDTLRRVKFIVDRFQKTASILDIGAGYGFFIDSLSKLGYQVKGIEVSKERRDVAAKITDVEILNIDLYNSTIEPYEQFDIITLFHVLEHLRDPAKFCTILRDYLVDGGHLVIEVPNLNDCMLNACAAYRSFYWQRAHISYFTPDTLVHVLTKVGFPEIEMICVQRYSITNMLNWRLFGKPQLLSPSFEVNKMFSWVDHYYKSRLEGTMRCVTLMVVAQKKEFK